MEDLAEKCMQLMGWGTCLHCDNEDTCIWLVNCKRHLWEVDEFLRDTYFRAAVEPWRAVAALALLHCVRYLDKRDRLSVPSLAMYLRVSFSAILYSLYTISRFSDTSIIHDVRQLMRILKVREPLSRIR